MDKFRHIHIGAGKIGLGLIVPITYKCGFEVIILNKENDPSEKQKYEKNTFLASRKYYTLYELEYIPSIKKPKAKNHDTVEYDSFFTFPEGTDRIDSRLQRLISSDPCPTLVTISVEIGNLKRIIPLLSRIMELHLLDYGVLKNKQFPIFVTACENGYRVTDRLKESLMKDPSSDRLKSQIKQFSDNKVLFINSLVDRVVPKDPVITGETLSMGVEQYYKWVIEISDIKSNIEDHKILKQQLGNKVVFTSSEEFTGWEVKKYVCLNALHLALGTLICWYKHFNNSISMMEAIEYLPEGLSIDIIQEKIKNIQEELSQAGCILTKHSLSYEEVMDYNIEVLDRIKKMPDLYLRPFKRLKETRDLIEEESISGQKMALLNLLYNAKVKEVTSERIQKEFSNKFEYYINRLSIYPFIHKLNERISKPLFALCAEETMNEDSTTFEAKKLYLFEILVKIARIIEKMPSLPQNLNN